MIFLCEQCGEKYEGGFELLTFFCTILHCGRELSPIISKRIEGVSIIEEEQIQHFTWLNKK